MTAILKKVGRSISDSFKDRLKELTETQIPNNEEAETITHSIPYDESDTGMMDMYQNNSHFKRNRENLKKFDEGEDTYILFINKKSKTSDESILNSNDETFLKSKVNGVKFIREDEFCGKILEYSDLKDGHNFIVTVAPCYVTDTGELEELNTEVTFCCNLFVNDDDTNSIFYKVYIQDRLPTPLFKQLNDNNRKFFSKDFRDKNKVATNQLLKEIEKDENDVSFDKGSGTDFSFESVSLPESSIFSEMNFSEHFINDDTIDRKPDLEEKLNKSSVSSTSEITKKEETEIKENIINETQIHKTMIVENNFEQFLNTNLSVYFVTLIDPKIFSIVNLSTISKADKVSLINNRKFEEQVIFNNSASLKDFDSSDSCMRIMAYNLLLQFVENEQ